MRKLLVIMLLAFYCAICDAQDCCRKDTIMYLAAYNYIVNDSINQGRLISVSDSIIDLERFWFSKDLVALPVEREKIVSYRANKKYVTSIPFYSPCIASLFGKNTLHSNVILFFSKVEDNMLRADLLPYKKHADKYNYNQMAFQNVGQVYLFIFNSSFGFSIAA